MPSTKALDEKKLIVDEIKEKISNAKTMVFFDYSGLSDTDSKDLRTKLKDNSSEYKVYKNTLLKLALKDLNIELDNYLEGPTAVVFSSDDIGAIKVLSECVKNHKDMDLKVGLVEGSIADKAKLNELATIPSREGLYTMLAGGMIGIVKDLSIALNLLAEQKEN